jgi:hypothetical protein
MHASVPVPASGQTTPTSGIGPQPRSPLEQGVVLGGSAQTLFHAHTPSFSLPQVEPRKTLPAGHTSAVGASPQSLSGHCRKLTDVPSDHPHPAPSGLQRGLASSPGAVPHWSALHGDVNVWLPLFGWGCG